MSLYGSATTDFEETHAPIQDDVARGRRSDAAGRLRQSELNLLHEHIYLTSQATGSAIEGNTDDFNAYAQADQDNGFAIGKAIVCIYAWAYTVGLPVGPDTGMPEMLTALGLTATGSQLAAAAGACLLLSERPRATQPRRSGSITWSP